ncbi:hypothetical protein BJ912DRAFT_1063139 [Pholiota molesta]|nr:hypothetical protein BJ912DRAFT_1063139 [Pholiota molesta]
MVSPFDSVPNELISMILQEAAIENPCEPIPDVPNILIPEDEEELGPDPVFAVRHLDLDTIFSMSLVCKRWREVSLSASKTWAYTVNVDYYKLSWIQQAADRTNILMIHSDSWFAYTLSGERTCFDEPNWKFVLSLVKKWGSFSLLAPLGVSNMDPLVQALSQHAPRLEVFQINNVDQDWADDFDDEDQATFNKALFVLPDDLFAGHAPCLRRFAITGVYLRPTFDFSIWAQLTELHIDQFLGGLQGLKISSRQWLEILRSMEQLEVLILAWSHGKCFDDVLHLVSSDLNPDGSLETVTDVHLGHLRKLALVATLERDIMCDIFPKLIVPDTCITSVTVAHYDHDELPFDWLAEGLDRRVVGWSTASIPFRVYLLRSISVFGFRIDLNPEAIDLETTNLGKYNFQFRYIDYRPYVQPPLPFHSTPPSRIIDILRDHRGPQGWLTFDTNPLPIDFSVIEHAFT